MKLEITKDEQNMLIQAIEIKQAALNRATKSETSEAVKTIRKNENSTYEVLKNKIATQELPK